MKLKKWIGTALLFLLLFAIIIYHNEVSHFIVKTVIYRNYAVETLKTNSYSQRKDYQFVQITDDFIAKDYQHLLNIFYTILDSGETSFYFFCDDEYKNCLADVDSLTPNANNANTLLDESPLADVNNFVHPYNSYSAISITPNNFGKVEVLVEKQYSNDKIDLVNAKIAEIRKEIEKENMSDEQKLKAFHDYIINHTKYDIDRASNMNHPDFKDSTTHTAYGLVETNMALCGGYSDMVSIYLHQLNIPNIKVSTSNHVWNLIYLDNSWKHLDVTWDDPVTDTGEDILIDDYFLVTKKRLMELDSVVHQFNETIYAEAK